MKIHILAGVTAVTLAASAALGNGLSTYGLPGDPAPPPPPVVNCSIADSNVTVTSFADILGYQFSGPCTVTFPGTNIKPVTSSYEGGGSWTAATGAVNEFIKGRDAKGQLWEVRGSANCKLDPWMTGVAAGGCNGRIASATPNAPHNVFKTMKVPVTADILDQSTRATLTAKALQAMALEHAAPVIAKPLSGADITWPLVLVIVVGPDSPVKNFALEWQAVVNGAWTPRTVTDQAGQTSSFTADRFGGLVEWRVRARAHESTKASWSPWREFQLPAAPACANSAAYGATYDVSATPVTLKAGASTTAMIKVTNGSNQTWGAGSNFHLSYHWAQNGAIVIQDGKRTILAAAIAPCQSVTLTASVQAPPSAGNWTIEWDMVNEGVTWFSSKGVPTGNKFVSVTP